MNNHIDKIIANEIRVVITFPNKIFSDDLILSLINKKYGIKVLSNLSNFFPNHKSESASAVMIFNVFCNCANSIFFNDLLLSLDEIKANYYSIVSIGFDDTLASIGNILNKKNE